MPKKERPPRPPRSPESMLAWARFWGRYVDVLILSIIVIVVFGAVYPKAARWNDYLLTLLALPVVLVIISVIQASFGQTLGNLIVGVKIQKLSGDRLDFLTAIKREAHVYIYGLCLGLPLFSLLTLGSCYGDLRDRGAVTYDRKLSTTVVSCGSNPARTWLICILYLLAAGTLRVIGQARENEVTPADTAASSSSPATPSLNDQLKQAAASLKPKLPMQLDRITNLVDVSASDKTITYTYEIKSTPDNFSLSSDKLQVMLQQKYCGPDSPFKQVGADQVFDYFTPGHQRHLGSFFFQPSACNTADPANTAG